MAPVPVQPVSPAEDAPAALPAEAAAVARDLSELTDQHLPPSKEEVWADMKWLLDRLTGPELAPYRRSFVAVAGGKVLGSGPDPIRLRRDVARDHGLHPGRLYVDYVHDPDRVFDDGDDVHDYT